MTHRFDDDSGTGFSIGKVGAALLAVVLLIGGVIALFGLSQNKVGATRWGCVYGAGLLDTPGLKMTVAPGTRGGFTIYDKMVEIPSDARSYTIDADQGVRDAGAVPIVLPVRARDLEVNGETVESEGITNVSIELAIRFMFNENVCDWYNKVGRGAEPLNMDAPEGEATNWTKFLNNTVQRRIREAMRPIVAQYDWLELTTNKTVSVDGGDKPIFDVLAGEVSTALSRELQSSLGGNYFCGPTYTFDGKADGELDNCPALEVSMDTIVPENPELITNYQAIVANAEAQLKIESDADRAIATAKAASEQQIAEANSASATAVAKAEADKAAQLAEQTRAQEVGVATANAELAIAQAQAEVARQEAANQGLEAEGETARCRLLAEVGVNCALVDAAAAGLPVVPQIVSGDSGGVLLQVPAPAAPAQTAE